MKSTILYATLHNGTWMGFYSDPWFVQEGFSHPVNIVRVIVKEAAQESGYWAWWDNEDQEFMFVYCSPILLDACFHYGAKIEENLGLGKILPVTIEVI